MNPFQTGSRLIQIVLFSALVTSAAADTAPTPTRPNILFLFSDDQRADALGAAPNPYVKTPNLDRLAQRGFYFHEAHVMGGHHGAICAPSRAMLMTGRQLFRVYDNMDSIPTLGEVLGAAGYATYGTGKWHNGKVSFEKTFQRGRRILFGGMGNHFQLPLCDLLPDRTFTKPVKQGFSTTLFADTAVDFLNEHAAQGDTRPFFLYVAFNVPHDPRTPPPSFADAYSGPSLPLPPNFMPVHPFNLGKTTMGIRDEMLAPWPRTPEVIRSQIADYYGLISHLDQEIGRILETLRRNGQYENTLIVFASDNGLALGSHGLLGKQSLYEHSTRVPLMIAGPGIPHGASDALVYLFDIAPTLYRLTGTTPPDGMDGHDLLPICRGEAAAVRSSLYTVYTDEQRAVRDARWKLFRHPKLHLTRLFDLKNDPYELHDLAPNPEFAERVKDMTELLETWHQKTADPKPLTAPDADPVQPWDYSRVERKPDPWQPPSIIDRYFK